MPCPCDTSYHDLDVLGFTSGLENGYKHDYLSCIITACCLFPVTCKAKPTENPPHRLKTNRK